MSDAHIQTQPNPDDKQEPIVDQLMRRVSALEQEKKHWKMVAIVTLLVLLAIGVGSGMVTLGIGSVYWTAARREQEQMRVMEEAQRQAEMARLQAEVAMQMRQAELARLQALQAAEQANRERGAVK